jgi:hypothetical protein
MGADLADPAVLADELAETVTRLHARLDAIAPADVARRVGVDLQRRTRPQPIGPLAQLLAADALTGETSLRLRPQLRVRVEADTDEVRLVLLDRTVRLPAHAADAVKAMLAGAPLTPSTLPGLDAEQQLAIARELISAGVLVPV